MILADIATAQEMAGKLGRLDHIDLILSGVHCAADSSERR